MKRKAKTKPTNWKALAKEATAQRDAAREAGVKISFKLGECMEALDASKASVANLRALCNELEGKLRDSTEPPCSSKDLKELRHLLSRLRTENEAYVARFQTDQAEIERLRQLKIPGPSLKNGARTALQKTARGLGLHKR